MQAGEKQERKCEALQKELDSRNDQLKREKESDEKQSSKNAQAVKQTANEAEKHEAGTSKREALANIAQLMESELQCSICNELFIKATSLGCAHSFCALCIEQWMDVKKVCPVCRAPIASKMNSVALDSYIERMLEELSPEVIEKRKKLVQERKGFEVASPIDRILCICQLLFRCRGI